ncbi:MAG: peptide chain release factor N(5)-glutamine methyltransferase [Rickettsiales bacterium TMED289]|nr:MAG: peptide chain release factor N(5)-glutamine methyltransferase [Rickettsiales bacterium TMED289]|tara:strand:+ start:1654 stop:2493 length:840 start_codon:yes stop_codon:yes gene_type:complete
MIYDQLLFRGKEILKSKSIINASLDSELLLAEVLKISREKLLINLNKEAKNFEIEKFLFNINKRINNIPIAYILRKKEFWKTNFLLDRSVLIPRPETEILVEEVLKNIKKEQKKNILDVGTGSGCILISILKDRCHCMGTGIDLSRNALKIAKINAKMQHLSNRIKFIHSDIDKFKLNKYDIVVSNPPYIKKCLLNALSEDVKNEPTLALDGGLNGSNQIYKVIKVSAKILKKNGIMIIEIDETLLENIKKILKKYKFFLKNIVRDLRGHKRCIVSIKI